MTATQPSPETGNARYYDNTILSSYKDCPRRYFIRHQLNWRSTGTSLPLSFGLSWHSAMDVVWQFAKKLPPPDLRDLAYAKFCETWEGQGLPVNLPVELIDEYSPRTPMIASEMISNYISTRWKMLQEAEVVAIEQPFAVPLPDANNVWYIGRLDKVITWNGETVALEHKTTTSYKKDGHFRSDYVESWFSDSQTKGYQFGAGLFFPGLKQVWVDAALVHKQVHNGFRFIPIAHQDVLLREWLDDTREWVGRLELDVAMFQAGNNQLLEGTFPKNENSCIGKYGPCPYLSICRTNSRPDKLEEPPEGYMVEKWAPFELLGIDKLVNKEPENA